MDLVRAFLEKDSEREQSSASPTLPVVSSLPADLSNKGSRSHDPDNHLVVPAKDSSISVMGSARKAPVDGMGETCAKGLEHELAKEAEETHSQAFVDVGRDQVIERAHSDGDGRANLLWKVLLWVSAAWRRALERIWY